MNSAGSASAFGASPPPAPEQQDRAFEFHAFLSYSHAGDGSLAPAIQSGLQQFAKPWNRLRAVRLFRDKTGMTANPGLWSAIVAALNSSRYFVLLASPGAANSHWVNKEVEHWLAERPAGNILIALTDGEIAWDPLTNDFDWKSTNALPPALRGKLHEEPLWVDLRFARKEQHLVLGNPAFRDAIADLSSALRGIPKDQLIGEDVRQFRKGLIFRRSVITGLVILTLAAVIAAVLALKERNLANVNEAQAQINEKKAEFNAGVAAKNEGIAKDNEALAKKNEIRALKGEADAREEADRALARQLAAQSEALRARRTELPRAALLAIEAVRRDPSAEADDALQSALALLPMPLRELDLQGAVQQAVFDRKAELLLVSRKNTAAVWDLKAGIPLTSVSRNISGMAMSQDGQKFALSDHCKVTLYDSHSGLELAAADLKRRVEPFSVPGCIEITVMSFSPDGRLIAATGDSLISRVWDTQTGEIHDLGDRGPAMADSLAFSSDGKFLTSVRYGSITMWSTADWRQKNMDGSPPPSWGGAAVFSPNRGELLGAVSGYGASIWNTATGKRIKTMTLAGNNYARRVVLAFNPVVEADMGGVGEGTTLAASVGSEAVLWDLTGNRELGREIAHLSHRDAIISLVFSRDSQHVLTASEDHTASLWEVSGGREVARFVHEAPLVAAAFGNEGVVYTVDADGKARLWQISRQSQAAGVQGAPLLFSADGKLLAVGQEFQTVILDAARLAIGEVSSRFQGQYYHLWSGAPGSFLVAQYANSGLAVRDLMKNKQVLFLKNNAIDKEVDSGSFTHGIDGAFFSENGKYIAIHGPSYAGVWEVASGRKLNLADSTGQMVDIFLSPDSRFAAVRLKDGSIRVVQLSSGQVVAHIAANLQKPKVRLVFSSDGRYLASMETPVRVWDTHAAGSPLVFSSNELSAETFTADGRYLVLRGADDSIVISDLAKGRKTEPRLRGYARIAVSPGQDLIAIGIGDSVHLWNAGTGHEEGVLDPGSVSSLSFSPDGNFLATGSSDGMMRVWAVKSRQEILGVPYKSAVDHVVFSRDGRFIAAGVTPSGLAVSDSYVVLLRPADVLQETCARLKRNLTQAEWAEHLGGSPYRKTCPKLP